MLVHFSGSESNLGEDLKYYRKIIEAIESAGCRVAINWLDDALAHEKKKLEVDKRDWPSIHKRNIDALNSSQLCIFEASARSFSVGFQTALALQFQKPALVLTRNDSLRNTFGSGIVSSLLTYKTYDEHSLASIVAKFIDENNLTANDLRFNFVIDREIYNYLRSAAFKNNTTKADVVRRLIRGKIDESQR